MLYFDDAQAVRLHGFADHHGTVQDAFVRLTCFCAGRCVDPGSVSPNLRAAF